MIDQPELGQIEWSGNYYDGTWNWLANEAPPLLGWDMNATQHAEMQFTSNFSVDENLMATGSFALLTTWENRQRHQLQFLSLRPCFSCFADRLLSVGCAAERVSANA